MCWTCDGNVFFAVKQNILDISLTDIFFKSLRHQQINYSVFSCPFSQYLEVKIENRILTCIFGFFCGHRLRCHFFDSFLFHVIGHFFDISISAENNYKFFDEIFDFTRFMTRRKVLISTQHTINPFDLKRNYCFFIKNKKSAHWNGSNRQSKKETCHTATFAKAPSKLNA